MDAYEQISPKRFRRVLIVMIFGFFLSIGLGLLLFMIFVENYQFYFDQITTIAESFAGINPAMTYFLGSGIYSLNAASPFAYNIFSSIGIEAQIILSEMILPAILTWLITGCIMGFFCKRWDDGLFSGLLCGIATWLFIVIATRILIVGPDTSLGVGELFYGLAVFMMLVNSAAAILICMFGGVIGGLLYSKVLFRQKALIEEYV